MTDTRAAIALTVFLLALPLAACEDFPVLSLRVNAASGTEYNLAGTTWAEYECDAEPDTVNTGTLISFRSSDVTITSTLLTASESGQFCTPDESTSTSLGLTLRGDQGDVTWDAAPPAGADDTVAATRADGSGSDDAGDPVRTQLILFVVDTVSPPTLHLADARDADPGSLDDGYPTVLPSQGARRVN